MFCFQHPSQSVVACQIESYSHSNQFQEDNNFLTQLQMSLANDPTNNNLEDLNTLSFDMNLETMQGIDSVEFDISPSDLDSIIQNDFSQHNCNSTITNHPFHSDTTNNFHPFTEFEHKFQNEMPIPSSSFLNDHSNLQLSCNVPLLMNQTTLLTFPTSIETNTVPWMTTTSNFDKIHSNFPVSQFHGISSSNSNQLLIPQLIDVHSTNRLYSQPGQFPTTTKVNWNNRNEYCENNNNIDKNNLNNHRNFYTTNNCNELNLHSTNDDFTNEDMFSIGDEALFDCQIVTIVDINWFVEQATVRFHSNNIQIVVPIESLRAHQRNELTNNINENINLNHLQIKTTSPNIYQTPTITKSCSKQKSKCNSQHSNQNYEFIQADANDDSNHSQIEFDKLKTNLIHEFNKVERSSCISAVIASPTPASKVVDSDSISTPIINATNIRTKNSKLSDETMMKLPHLRKHIPYIKSIDTNMGPKDYNQYRVSARVANMNNNHNNSSKVTLEESINETQSDVHDVLIAENNYDINKEICKNENDHGLQQCNDECNNVDNNNNTNQEDINNVNIDNKTDKNAKNGKRPRFKRLTNDKEDLFKTELCENWIVKGSCSYGKKCHFAHGVDDIRNRLRLDNYKTQPCCDPARLDSRLCLFGKRCNYAHPGEPLRRPMPVPYEDAAYFEQVLKDYGDERYPFGIYI